MKDNNKFQKNNLNTKNNKKLKRIYRELSDRISNFMKIARKC